MEQQPVRAFHPFDRAAHLCGDSTASGCVILSGTLTCAETGLAELVSVTLQQRGLVGTDNPDLLDFACSPEPRSFNVIAETFGCDAPARPSTECFRPGPAVVEASVSGVVLTQGTVRVRKG